MANKKSYLIEINGIKESIDAVKSLNAQLDALEQRIKNLEGKVVKVGTSTSGGGGGGNASALSEEEKLEKEILATEEKISKVRSESYQKLLAAKEELKEATTYAKAQYAASENGQGLFDTNTMLGMKQQLSAIKQEMQTVDVNDDKFKQLTQQANELNNKLKEVEASYGQYQRNVGNYANGVAEGVSNLKIEIGGIEQEFDSAKQAMTELRREMQTLSTKKDMGVITSEEEERLKGLIPVVKQLESSVKDAGKPMDNLLDTMQGMVALASAAKGISSLFGFDNSAIEESIRQLMALQNIMQSLQVLQQQMQTGEGVGGWLAKGNAMIDEFVNKLFKAKTAQEQLNVAEKAGEATSKGVATAMEGQAAATTLATRAAQGLSAALKTIGIGLVVALIGELTEMYQEWVDEAKEAEEEAEAMRQKIEAQRQTFTNAASTYAETASRISNMRAQYLSTNNELKKTAILKTATEEFKKMGIAVRSLTDAQRILVQQGGQVIELLTLQGEAAGLSAIRVERFKQSFDALISNGYDVTSASILAGNNKIVVGIDERLAVLNQRMGKLKTTLGIGVNDAITSTGKEAGKAIKETESELTKLQIEAMRDGLNKTIAQLEEEKKQRINKIRANGRNVAEAVALVEKLYADKVLEARKEFARKMEEQSKKIWESIGRIDTDAQTTALQNMLTASENNLDKQLKEYQARLKKIYSDYAPSLAGISTEALANAGNISAAVKQGQISKEDGSIYSEKELEGLKHMADILEDIDFLRGKIYLKERQEVPVQNQYQSEIEQLTKKIDEQKEKLEKVKKDIADNTFSDDEFKNRFDKLYGEYIKYIREQKEALNQEAIAEENAMYERLRKIEQDNWDEVHEATTKRLQNELNALRGQKDAEIEATTEAYKKGEIDLKEHYERNLAIQQKYAELAASKEEAIVDEQARIAEKYQQNLDNLLAGHNAKLKEIAGNTSDRIEAVLADDLKSQIAEKLKELDDYQAAIEDAIKRNTEALAHYQQLAASNVGIQFGGESLEELYKLLHEAEEARDKILRDNGITEEQLKKDVIFDLLQEENYTRRLNNQFIARLGNHIKYYDDVEKANREHWAKVLEADKANLKTEYQQQVDAASRELEELKKKLDEQEKLEIGAVDENSDTAQQKIAGIRQKYLDQYLQAQEKTGELINQLWDKYHEELRAKEVDYQHNVQTEVAKSQNNIISEYRDFYSKLSALQQEQPIQDAWGIVNMHHTRSNYRSIISGFTQLSEAIIQQRRELQQKLAKNEITFDDFTQARRELNDLQTSVAQSLGDIENKSKNLIGDFMASINTYISAFGNAIQTVMQSLWDLEDYNFQKELDQIADENDVLDKKLSEQDDIVKKHADAVNSIEDELATARGDRRQSLIDQLNAEMMAQRAALAEQKKIEKQKENLEKRQKAIERKQKEAEYNRNLMSIVVSNAMAVANALATQPFVPTGIAMGSLAATLGAVQYTIAKKQKPYEHGGQLDGGVAVGKRHKDGGIPVLGGRAAIEGGEFITNRVTTSKNADLLSYINSKKKKVDVADLLEFFSSEKTRKNITGVRTKFANGGIIPSVTTEFGNAMSNTIVVRDDSVYQVSVVDINNAQDNVKNVQVLAGL